MKIRNFHKYREVSFCSLVTKKSQELICQVERFVYLNIHHIENLLK